MKRLIAIFIFLPILDLSISSADIISSEIRLSNAVRSFQGEDYNKVIDELNNIDQESDKDKPFFEASYLLGMSYRALKKWDDAAKWLEISSKYQPLADYSIYYLGETHFNSGNYLSSIESFSTLRSKFPDSRWREEGGFKASMALFQLGRYVESISSFERFINENPRSPLIPQARITMAEGIEKTGGPREAYSRYKDIWLNFPSSPEARASLERMMQISLNESSSNLSPPISIEERYKRACNLLSNNIYRETISELRPILDEAKKDGAEKTGWFAEGLLKLGEAYYQIREDGNAVATLKRIPETASSTILEEAAFLSGKALQRSGNRIEAVQAFENLIRKYPKGAFAAKAAFRIADMAEGDGDTLKARELYRIFYAYFPKNNLADDALWKEGWLTYLEKDYKGASTLFQKLLAEYPSSEFADTVTYWAGRAAEKAGLTDDSVGHYTRVINNYPLSYYAAISRGRLSVASSDIPLPLQVKTTSYTPKQVNLYVGSSPPAAPMEILNTSPIPPPPIPGGKGEIFMVKPGRYVSFHFNKGNILLGLGFREDASAEFSLAESRCDDKGTLLEIARLLTEIGDYHKVQRIMIKGFQRYLREDLDQANNEIWRFSFPTGFSDDIRVNAETNSLNPYLVHAIIREESSYRMDAVSRAGAVGLMQLMPTTGSILSKQTGFKDYSTQFLYRPEINIALGSLYLKRLIEDYKGNVPLAVASYNAGPNAVSTWISRYGIDEMDEFIEKIPYSETRNYVKKVLRSYEIYERLYGSNVKDEDLKGLALK